MPEIKTEDLLMLVLYDTGELNQDLLQLKMDLDDVLNKMEEEDRSLLLMNKVYGYTQQEISTYFGMNQGTVSRKVDASLQWVEKQVKN